MRDPDARSREADRSETQTPRSSTFSRLSLRLTGERSRRLFSRSRPDLNDMSSSSNNVDDATRSARSSFNPQATEFVPGSAASRSSKRKASSSARPGQAGAGPPSSRGAFGRPNSGENELLTEHVASYTHSRVPLIKAKDIFGTEELGPRKLDADAELMFGLDSDDDEDDISAVPLPHITNVRLAERMRQRLRRNLSRVSAWDSRDIGLLEKATPHASQRLSAILISRSAVSDDADGLKYLPLCAANNAPARNPDLTVLPSHRRRTVATSNAGPSRCTWPANKLPVELFEIITLYLSRDDVEAMRLVCREFEAKVATTLFHTSVVPFNTELYDMIEEGTKSKARQSNRKVKYQGKGKGRATDDNPLEVDPLAGQLQWQNAKEDKEGKVYKGHGLRVFEGFGPHIKRFGMTFEVSENQLLQPSAKKELDHVDSYHGTYDWPTSEYARFDDRAGLERTADETSRMKAAFSKLSIVQELALSVDSGLGWLSGPDKSVCSQILNTPPPIFGRLHQASDRKSQAAVDFWNALQESQDSFTAGVSNKEITLASVPLKMPPDQVPGLMNTSYGDPTTWSDTDQSILPADIATSQAAHRVLYTTSVADPNAMNMAANTLTPNELRKEQKEWLLETEWAQQAFLESYTLAVIDNPGFARITSLRIAKLSSRFIDKVSIAAFWAALPALQDVLIHVSPDWRTVAKDDAGFAEMSPIHPSDAVRSFYDLVRQHIVTLQLRRLNIGWVRESGGEHAQGMFARNNHLLPAPICQLERAMASTVGFNLVFRDVEHLTLTNCWMTPPMLQGLVETHVSHRLKKLTLDSVSMTAHPRFPAGAPQNAQQAIQQQLAQQIFANQQQGAQQPPLLALGGLLPQHVQPPPAAAQQQMMQMLQNAMNQPMGQLQNIPGVPGIPAINAFGAGNPPANTHWSEGHREGSWPELLNHVSPGPVFTDFLPAPQPWEAQHPPRPSTNLQTIECISCGYARLNNSNTFDQLVLEQGLHFGPMSSTWFRMRQAALKPMMMETRDKYVGQIVQHMNRRELDALQFAWGMTRGWADAAKSEEAEYDGFLPGGTGRFSGVIQRV